MTAYYVSYAAVATLAAVILLFGVGTFVAWRALRPQRPNREKLENYECGIDPIGESWKQPNVRYYIFAFLFVVFDVEALFLFPWAVVYERLGLFAVVEMVLFVAILLFGLVYAWGKRVLEWT
ncbi:MAG TPA: NADH-quinone oxidoreductase subunit A [Actinomycetota bacterium]|jgi:NADH-quinone oxidoreductase subunit A|nr:NADH-quinone oxidoreductase subunit A [Actinomycetota bacterium]